MQIKYFIGVLAACLSLFAGTTQAITIQFDYTYDTAGFFTTDMRTVLNEVASVYDNNLTDSLSAITSAGSNHATLDFFDPTNDANDIALTNQSIAANTLRIYVGSSDLGAGVLAEGGPGSTAGSTGSPSFLTTLRTRGQTGAGLATPTDFGPWGGSVSFSDSTAWYDDTNVATTEPFSGYDFFSVALHEVGHVLGIGTADSWRTDVSGTSFVGSNAESVNGGPVGLTADGAHWAAGTTSLVNGVSQEAVMSPSISAGQRKYFTQLDWAGLRDLGWQVTSLDASPVLAVPEPAQYAMLLAGLGMIGVVARRRSA